ncbi:unnamed protein product [Adineta ricciae]|uniref:Uncharacterized protein n=1 Tax=Adineta ricciae TaxID=249248 RepID=A0A815C9H5_ADIRI|nr:unnamed protein product [Adineta ricciae]
MRNPIVFYCSFLFQNLFLRKVMENTEAPIQTEEPTTVVEPVAEDTSKINEDSITTKETLKMNGEQSTPVEEEVKTNGQEATTEDVSSKTMEETSVEKKQEEEETAPLNKSVTEQENVTDVCTTVPAACVSPGRANVPLKEVNESEKEESTVISNGTDSTNSKKRELEQEDESTEETATDSDDRSNDQTKKIKIAEPTETPIIEFDSIDTNIRRNIYSIYIQ